MGLFGRIGAWLSWKWLWLSHVYPFYWAHKPLCGRFRRDVVRFGRVHVCRSCLMVYTGLALGTLLCILFREPLRDAATGTFAVLAGLTLALSFPVWYRRWPRPLRDALRGMIGLSIALCGYLLLSGGLLPGLIGLAVMGLFWKGFQVVRTSNSSKACSGCPDLHENKVCPGFALQAQLIRIYEEKATERMLADGHTPHAIPRRQGP